MAKRIPLKKKTRSGYLHFSGPQNNLASGILTDPGFAANASNLGLKRARLAVTIQSLSHVRPHELQHTRLPCPSLFSLSLLQLMSIESVMPANHLILCCPLLLLLSVFPSIRVFTNEWTLRIGWSKYWSFSRLAGGAAKYRLGGLFPWSIPAPLPVYEGTKSHQ